MRVIEEIRNQGTISKASNAPKERVQGLVRSDTLSACGDHRRHSTHLHHPQGETCKACKLEENTQAGAGPGHPFPAELSGQCVLHSWELSTGGISSLWSRMELGTNSSAEKNPATMGLPSCLLRTLNRISELSNLW